MVKDVFPHFTVDGICTALSFYNHDVQQFILDASMDNLPPHLAPILISNDNAIAAALAQPTREAATTTPSHDAQNLSNIFSTTDNSKNNGVIGSNNGLASMHLDLFSSSSSGAHNQMNDTDYDSTLLAQDLFQYLSGMARSLPPRTDSVKIANTEHEDYTENRDKKDDKSDSDDFNFDLALDDQDEMDDVMSDNVDKQQFYTR